MANGKTIAAIIIGTALAGVYFLTRKKAPAPANKKPARRPRTKKE